MAIDPVLLARINEGFSGFLNKVNAKGEKYFPSVANRNRMIQWLKAEQVAVQDWISPNVWMACYGNLSASESLETRPAENMKTRAELEQEWEAKDRFDGSPAARSRTNVSEKTPGQWLKEISDTSQDKTKRAISNIQKIAEAEQEQARFDNDWSRVPTVDAIRSGSRLNKREQYALPSPMLRKYVQLLQQVENEELVRQQVEARNAG